MADTQPTPQPEEQAALGTGSMPVSRRKQFMIVTLLVIAGVGVILNRKPVTTAPAATHERADMDQPLDPNVPLQWKHQYQEAKRQMEEAKARRDTLAAQYASQSNNAPATDPNLALAQQAALADAERQREQFNQAKAPMQPQAGSYPASYPSASTAASSVAPSSEHGIGKIGFDAIASPSAPADAEPSTPPNPAPASAAVSTPEPKEKRAALDYNEEWPTVILPAGTVIEGILVNRLDGSANGPVLVQAAEPVYYPGSHQLILPAGSRFYGQAATVSNLGQTRLGVSFTRAIVYGRSRIYSIPLLSSTPGLDQQGAVGLTGKVNSHVASVFAASLAIGAIGGLANIGNFSIGYSPMSQFRTGIAESMAQSSEHILDRFINRLPNITIKEGTRVRIILVDDWTAPLYN